MAACIASSARAAVPAPRTTAIAATKNAKLSNRATNFGTSKRYTAPSARASRRVSRRAVAVTAVASPSMPAAPQIPLPDFLRAPFDGIAKQVEASLSVDVKRQLLRAQYTSAISLRVAFFLQQGVRQSQLSGKSSVDGAAVATALAKAVLAPDSTTKVADADSKLGNIVSSAADGQPLSDAEAGEITQFLEQHLVCIVDLFRTELEHLEAGHYKYPYDLSPVTGPQSQWNPLAVNRLSRDALADQADVSERRTAKRGQELLDKFAPDPERYPAYYLQNFHYQTDGWLSADSARLYDFQVETLFLGSADTMRRQALPFITAWMKGRSAKDTKLLDVASGTGRFLTFVRDNFPEMQCTALELSPHYLEAARKMNKRFETMPGAGPLKLVEANCEKMPFPDGEFDAITNVYLFHEMPKEARRNAAREYARVLKPGGKLFFVDSAQVGDGKVLGMEKAFDQALERFPMFNHEPYYRDYANCDLAATFGEFGLELEDSTVAWVSKCMSFTKKASADLGSGVEAGAAGAPDQKEVPATTVTTATVEEAPEAESSEPVAVYL